MEIKEFDPKDRDKIKKFVKASIESVLGLRAKGLGDMDAIESNFEIFYYALDNNRVVGTVGIKAEEGVARISRMFVRENYKDKGLDQELLNKAVEYCKNKGYSSIILIISDKNPYLNFYEKMGFKHYRDFDKKIWLKYEAS